MRGTGTKGEKTPQVAHGTRVNGVEEKKKNRNKKGNVVERENKLRAAKDRNEKEKGGTKRGSRATVSTLTTFEGDQVRRTNKQVKTYTEGEKKVSDVQGRPSQEIINKKGKTGRKGSQERLGGGGVGGCVGGGLGEGLVRWVCLVGGVFLGKPNSNAKAERKTNKPIINGIGRRLKRWPARGGGGFVNWGVKWGWGAFGLGGKITKKRKVRRKETGKLMYYWRKGVAQRNKRACCVA